MARNPNREDLRVIRDDGSVMLREVLVFVLYFETPHSQMAKAVADSIREYIDFVSFDALSVFYDYEGLPQPLNRQSLDDLFELRFFGRLAAPNANIVLASDNTDAREFYLWYNGKALDNPTTKDERGYLWCWMPRKYYRERADQVWELLMSIAANLPICCGYASLGLAERNKLEMQALARRHPGLDIAQPLCVSADLDDKVAGSYWLTLLGKKLTAKCGGSAELRKALTSNAIVANLPEGKTSVTLGDEPQIGDTNRRSFLPDYKALAQFLGARGLLHVPDRVVYFVDSFGRADKDAMVDWHQRFLD